MPGRLQRVRDASARGARRGAKACKRGIVEVITSEKIIQAGLTSALFGAMSFYIEGVAVYAQMLVAELLGILVHAKVIGGTALIGVFWLFYWADRNTERFRELVEEATGEEAAEDDPDDDAGVELGPAQEEDVVDEHQDEE